MVKEAGRASTIDINRTCSNRGSRENEYDNGTVPIEDRRGSTEPINNEYG